MPVTVPAMSYTSLTAKRRPSNGPRPVGASCTGSKSRKPFSSVTGVSIVDYMPDTTVRGNHRLISGNRLTISRAISASHTSGSAPRTASE